MSPPPSRRTVFLHVAETWLIGATGGVLFTLAGFPAGLVSGSVLAVALAALAGRPVMVPFSLARIVMVVIGIALGSVVTPATLGGLAAYPLSIALLSLSTVVIILATASYLRLVHGWDKMSAMFGASPGALAQIIVLASEFGADLRGVIVVQTMRVLFLTLGIPAGLALLGIASSASRGVPGGETASPLELLVLVATSSLTAIALYKVKFPGGWIIGAMFGSGFLHGSGLIEGGLPWWLTGGAFTLLGGVTGSRFANTPLRLLLRYIGAAFGSFAVAMTVSTSFVLLVSTFLDVPLGDIVMAYSPGAQDTMMVLALALHLDPVFVGAHHLARYLIVSLGNPFLARMLADKGATES